jgi:hypothetical protein
MLRRGFIVDVDNLDNLVNWGKTNGAITNEGIYNSLQAHVKAIQKKQDDANNTANGLKSLKNEVNAQAGKKIEQSFADQLLLVIEELLKKYGGA